MAMRLNRGWLLKFALLCLLIGDSSYSFLQHYAAPFDGDMPAGIVPADDVAQILSRPLGLDALLGNDSYPNPNRFFSHWAFYQAFNNLPFLFNSIAGPLDSAYLSCATIKTLVQVLMILVMAFMVSGRLKL